jgi:O-glycosyl hydrolase
VALASTLIVLAFDSITSTSTDAATVADGAFQVTYAGQSFSYSLPPSSIATFEWVPGGSTANVWETTTTGGTLDQTLEQQPNVPFGPSVGSVPTITVTPSTPSTQMQTVAGFGGAMTQSAAKLINNSPDEQEIMNALFGPSGANFNIVRVPMAASNFITGPSYQNDTSYSYDDNNGVADPSLSNFSIGTQAQQPTPCTPASNEGQYGTGDYADTIPALLCAESEQPNLRVLGVPWSAPGWMKIDDSTIPEQCSGSDDYLENTSTNHSMYKTYSQYFVDFAEHYQSAGVPISAISMQNEPENCNTTYPTMEMASSDQALFVPDLRSAFDTANTDGKLSQIPTIMAYDDNFTDSDGKVTDYPETVIANSGGLNSPVGLVGFHHYDSTLGQEEKALDQMHAADPSVPIWMTEATGTNGSTTQAYNLVWEAQHDLMEPLQNWASASLYLNFALRSSGGPHVGGCGDCRGMVTVNGGGNYTLNEDYFDWAQFSKFVQPGATHICSDTITLPATVNSCSVSNPGAPTNGNNMIDSVAFQNPDGSVVLVALNTTPDGSSSSGEHIYWANSGSENAGDIGQANVDGTDVNESFLSAAETGGDPNGVAVSSSHVYWAQYDEDGGTEIGRANPNVNDANASFITGVSAPEDVVVTSSYLYWTNYGNGTIGRANLNGTGVKMGFITGAHKPIGLAVNASYIYWTNEDGDIGRANLDGTDANKSFITATGNPYGVAVDSSHIYWSNLDSNTIGRANLNGTDANESFITGADYPAGLAIQP